MRFHATLMAGAAALALGFGAAYAADQAPNAADQAPGAKSDITIAGQAPDAGNAPGSNVDNSGSSANEGALSAPEKGSSMAAPSTEGGANADSAVQVPGSSAESGSGTDANPGATSAPEKDRM